MSTLLFDLGAEVYRREAHCITCHQADGQGLPAAQFPTSTTNIVVYVWRNVGVGAEAEIYTISSPAITAKPGDATRNLLKVPADPAALLTDTITVMVMQASSGKRAGPGLGSVVSS